MKRIIIIALIVFATIVQIYAQQGQIICTTYEPDSCYNITSYQDTLKIDLDQDGSGDILFYIGYHGISSQVMYINSTADWQWSWDYENQPGPLTDSTMIDDGSLRWHSYPYMMGVNASYHHFAFRRATAEGYCYGWGYVYLNLDLGQTPPTTVCISKTGYCPLPGQIIQWGQTELLGADENEEKVFIQLQPNPTNGLITITGLNLKQAEVINMLGQHVATAQGDRESLTVDFSGLPAGVYFVNVTDEEGRKCVRKVVKE